MNSEKTYLSLFHLESVFLKGEFLAEVFAEVLDHFCAPSVDQMIL